MRGKFMRLCGVLVASAAVVYGCGEGAGPVAPEAPPSHGLVGDLVGTLLGTTSTIVGTLTGVTVLQRNAPLETDIPVTERIGREGGVIEIPEAGLRVVFPQDALVLPRGQSDIAITVTAVKGDEVAYTFQPHGLRFRAPVTVVQDAQDTRAYRNKALLPAIEGAYFPTLTNLNSLLGIASVLEFRPTKVDVTGSTISFTVDHFSGYLIASGRQRR